MRTQQEFIRVIELLAQGHNDCAISRLTGIPRTTVRDWRRGVGDPNRPRSPQAAAVCGVDHDFAELPAAPYSYLLGIYLGDGYLARVNSVWRICITLDAKYPGIIDQCCRALEAVMPGKRANHRLRPTCSCEDVTMYSKHWSCLFPQHRPGRKHERAIVLEEWQQEIVICETESFIRGLIHSDGCRVVANDRGVASVRYHFTNRSKDVKHLLCEALDRLGIPWTRPSDDQVAVYRKWATARLDEFIGPKR